MSADLRREFSAEDQALLKRLLTRPLLLPPEFKSWLYKFASLDAMPHFQELLGVQERRWRVADPVVDLQAVSGTNWQDLATVGPQLSALENGTYMFAFGFYTQSGTSSSRQARIEYDGGASTSAPAEVIGEGQAIMFDLRTLSSTTNTHTAKLRYLVPGGSGSFSKRWLVGVQVAT